MQRIFRNATNNMATTEVEHAGDCPDEVESLDDEETSRHTDDGKEFPSNFQQNIEWLALLPAPVKRRIKALKKLQLASTQIEAEFFKEVHTLECKYHKMYVPLYEKRSLIVNGDYEPTDEESQWPSDNEDDLPDALKEKLKLERAKQTDAVDAKGIPEFWLTVFKNVGLLADMVQPYDAPILRHLVDIKIVCRDAPNMGFTLEFHFAPNEHFTNKVLSKSYVMKCAPDEEDPFNFEGPEIYKCTGCTINWLPGKDVTVKTIKKRQKHKSRGTVRTVTKTVQNDSFFNFFTPPTIPENAKDEDVDEDTRNLLTTDFEIGHYIRERVVPRAVLFFTGEGCDEEEDYEEEEDDEDDDEEEAGDSDGKENTKSKKQEGGK